MKKRFVAFTCIITILFTFFAASCSTTNNSKNTGSDQIAEQSKETTTSENTKNDQNTEKGYTLPLVTEPTTLRYGTIENYYSPKSYTLNLPVWQEIEKNTGVKIEWDVTPSAQYSTVMATRLAAGTDLPDIIMVPGDPMTYIPSGLFAELNDLIDQYAPNIKKMLDEDKRLQKLFTAPDGKIYTLSVPTEAQDIVQPYGYIVRQDWMEKLSINEPTTIDDWYNMLVKFKNSDPNANNQADEVPFTCQNTFQLRHFFMVVIAITMFFGGGLIPMFILVNKLHLYNTRWAIILPGAVSAWNLVIARVFFQSTIPDSLPEAAKLDGCSEIGILFRIVMPLSMPIIAVLTLYYAVGHWNSYFNALLYLPDQKLQPVQIYLMKVLIEQSEEALGGLEDVGTRTSLAAQMKYTVIIIVVLPILCVYPFLQKYFVKGVMIGAIKE